MESLLYECDQCTLARDHSNARDVAEQHIVATTQAYGPSHLVYTAYAAGGLGFEARCLTQVLRHGWSHVTVILIDPLYRPMIKWLTQGKSEHATDRQVERSAHRQAPHTVATHLRRTDSFIRHLRHNAGATHVRVVVLPDAATYAQYVQSEPEMRANICTWIDPDVAVAPHPACTQGDSAYLMQSCADRTSIVILTVDNAHEPILIHNTHEYALTQSMCMSTRDHVRKHKVTCHARAVYPYDPIPGAIQIGSTIHIPSETDHPNTVALLYAVSTQLHLTRVCLPSYVRPSLDALASCSAPG